MFHSSKVRADSLNQSFVVHRISYVIDLSVDGSIDTIDVFYYIALHCIESMALIKSTNDIDAIDILVHDSIDVDILTMKSQVIQHN